MICRALDGVKSLATWAGFQRAGPFGCSCILLAGQKYAPGGNKETSTNSVATLFAWSGALRKRGELDGLSDLCDFADKLEKSVTEVIESGIMTGDLYLISTLENKKKVNTTEFLEAVKAKLDEMF